MARISRTSDADREQRTCQRVHLHHLLCAGKKWSVEGQKTIAVGKKNRQAANDSGGPKNTSFKSDFSVSPISRNSKIGSASLPKIPPGSMKPQAKLTFEIRHGEPVAVDPRRVDVRVKRPEGRRAYIVETLQHER